MALRKIHFRGKGVSALRESLLDLCLAGRWPMIEPLPVTRFLGNSFGISNVSAFRVLNALGDSGHLWRAPNGRYFLAEARRLLEKPAPVACLFRRLERWSAVGREMMQGIDEACGNLDRAILLVHDRVLFRQADETSPAAVGADQDLRAALEEFLLIHSERISGVILDELWPDRTLADFSERIKRGVMVYRRTRLRSLGCVRADTAAAARLAIEHARLNGFERVAVLLPFQGYPPSDEMAAAVRAASTGCFPQPPVFSLDSQASGRALVAALRKQRRRMLLVATEDNAAVAARELLAAAGIEIPRQVGIMSTMGSGISRDHSITSARFDFGLMGMEAARMAIGGPLRHLTLPPTLVTGATT